MTREEFEITYNDSIINRCDAGGKIGGWTITEAKETEIMDDLISRLNEMRNPKRKGGQMTNREAVNWIINLSADIGKAQHQDLWHYEQALSEIKYMLEAEPEIIYCKDCKYVTRWRSKESARKFGQVYECRRGVFTVPKPDDFCSCAERSADE